ncbi:MAG: M48 family metalloprotease [Saprospiraceae bacterium]
MAFNTISAKIIFAGFIFLISMASCRKNTGEEFGSNSSDFSAEEQVTLGKVILSNMQDRPQDFPILDPTQNAAAYSFLNDTILQTIVYGSPLNYRTNFEWEAVIIENDDIDNAFILPGGILVFYTGFLKFLEGNDEISAVMAHEIAYADSDRAIQKLTRRFDRFSLNALANNQRSNDLEDIADYYKSLVFLQNDVLFADSVSLNIMCPFNYKSTALLEILDRAKSNSLRIDWIEKRDAEYLVRKQAIQAQIQSNASCLEGEQLKLATAYQRFKTEYLP